MLRDHRGAPRCLTFYFLILFAGAAGVFLQSFAAESVPGFAMAADPSDSIAVLLAVFVLAAIGVFVAVRRIELPVILLVRRVCSRLSAGQSPPAPVPVTISPYDRFTRLRAVNVAVPRAPSAVVG